MFSRRIVDLIFLNFYFYRKKFVRYPHLQAPKIESVIECKTGSPSECPSVPTFDLIIIPPKYNFLLGTRRCISNPM